jgi:dipicolinate synthase subunit A
VLAGADVIINSVPSVIFNAASMKKIRADCLLIDLASKPGFEDMTGVIHALSLPGKVSPVTAGYIVADTIMNILEENGSNGI